MINNRIKRPKGILLILLLIITIVFVVIIFNVASVSFFKYHPMSGVDLTPYVENSNIVNETIISKRGYIYDKNGKIIAQDIKSYNIICYLDESRMIGNNPAHIEVKELSKTASILAEILGMDFQTVFNYIADDSKYQTELGSKGRNLSAEVKEEIESHNLPGIEFVETIKRNYPSNEFASYLIGFAQVDDTGHNVGKMGLELMLDDELSGTDGSRTYQAGKGNIILPGMQYEEELAINGNDVYCTLDETVQDALETAFDITNDTFKVDKAWGAVMEVDTGKILAWGQSPTFNPNELNIIDYTNNGSQMPYEAGSTMKVFTYAAAIDSGVYQPETYVDSTTFCYASSGTNPYRVPCGDSRKIGQINNANSKNWGMITYDDGLVYSSNVVTSSILTNLLDDALYEQYMHNFGFFNNVESNYIPEVNGILNYRYPSDKLALTYGQGSTVTMLQILQGYSSILSDGTMVKPYFVDEIRSSYNEQEVLFKAETEVVGNPIKEEAALKVQELMYNTANLDYGTARFYRIDETEIIAKTGTAQVSINGTYNSGKTISSVAVGLPADDPQYFVYYAFQADYDSGSHVKTDAVKYLLQKVAQTYNLSQIEFESNTEELLKIEDEEMPSLINHTLDYALNKVSDLNLNPIVLGSKDSIISQYPSAESLVRTNEKVFLLTDKSSILMPNMIGWTRSEVSDFWNITGIPIKMDGEGLVSAQSLPQGSQIDSSIQIEVKLD